MSDTDMDIVAMRVPERLSRRKIRDYLPWLSPAAQERMRKATHPQATCQILAGELLTRYVLGRRLRMTPHRLQFKVNRHGKPSVTISRRCHFNLSHSGQWIALAVADRPVGIDIQKIRPVDLAVARRFFSEEEYRALAGKSEAERHAFFFELWTLKESYVKAVGRGMTLPFRTFSIPIPGEKVIRYPGWGRKSYYFKTYEIDRGYTLSVCACDHRFPEAIELETFKDVVTALQREAPSPHRNVPERFRRSRS